MQQTSRRALIAGLAAAPMAIAFAGSAMSAPAAKAAETDAAFAQKVAAWRRIKAASDRFHLTRYTPVYEAMEAALAKWRGACEAIPHVTTKATYRSIDGANRSMTTADPAVVMLAKRFAADGAGDGSDFQVTCRELAAAVDQREAQTALLRDRFGLDSLDERLTPLVEQADALSDRSHAAYSAIMAHPASSLAVIIQKLDFLAEHDDEPECYWEEITRDIRTLASREA